MANGERYAKIAIAVPLRRLFEYRIPPSLQDRVIPGARVRVRFRGRRSIGYCISCHDEKEYPQVLDIEDAFDEPPILDDTLLELTQWTARYYLTPIGEVIEAAVPRAVRKERQRQVKWVTLQTAVVSPAMADASPRDRVLSALRDAGGELPFREVLDTAGVSESPVKTLERAGVVSVEKRDPGTIPFRPRRAPDTPRPELTAEQDDALAHVLDALDPGRFEAFLLHGVTGSGKTEVYLRAIEAALHAGRGALVLLPEIALTPQTLRRFEDRLGDVAVLHSMLPDGERAAQYGRLRRAEVRVAIGARSAIFAPIPDLGVIVVDESHEPTYKQESTPRYHARDLAVVRASQSGIPCILGTATPSLESLENARRGRFTKLLLPHRVTAHPLARIEIVDRRAEKPNRDGAVPLLSDRLVRRIQETLDRGEQTILFLNRRGFARNITCPTCGYGLRCDACDIALTYHKSAQRSLCHYCGAHQELPQTCPSCQFPGLRRRHAGTERIEELLKRLFPQANIDRLDRDTARSRERLEAILQRFREGQTQILVGTQIVAKGHDIPGVTLVGVIDADIALGLPDFRASERTAQLLCQVAGRAGRGDQPGRVVIQTRQPDHYAIEAARRQDLSLVLEQELSTRQDLAYPPHGHLVRVVCEDQDETRANESAKEIADRLRAALPMRDGSVLGPAPAPLSRLRTWYRFHILLKGRRREPIHRAAGSLGDASPRWSTTRVVVDVDPQSLL